VDVKIGEVLELVREKTPGFLCLSLCLFDEMFWVGYGYWGDFDDLCLAGF
jgi:hypothetical protein